MTARFAAPSSTRSPLGNCSAPMPAPSRRDGPGNGPTAGENASETRGPVRAPSEIRQRLAELRSKMSRAVGPDLARLAGEREALIWVLMGVSDPCEFHSWRTNPYRVEFPDGRVVVGTTLSCVACGLEGQRSHPTPADFTRADTWADMPAAPDPDETQKIVTRRPGEDPPNPRTSSRPPADAGRYSKHYDRDGKC